MGLPARPRRPDRESIGKPDLATHHLIFAKERHSRSLAVAIVRRAQASERPIRRRGGSRDIVGKGGEVEPGEIHPATRTFQGLRILVTRGTESCIGAVGGESVLKPAGRLVVVLFHSLEDRIVKNFRRARQGPDADRGICPSFGAGRDELHILTKRSGQPMGQVAENPRGGGKNCATTSVPSACAERGHLPGMATLAAVMREADPSGHPSPS